MSGMSTEASGDGGRLPSKTVLAAAAGTVVAAGAAYYVYSKWNKDVPFSDLKKLKDEGNTHFTQKRYKEAIACFTEVIDELSKSKQHDKNVNKDEKSVAEYAELLAACYQNRAAAKQASEDSPLEVISDCTHAIQLKPKYGRAYIRRSALLKQMEPKQALADALAAMHIDTNYSEKMVGIMGELMAALEKKNLDDFKRRKEANPVKKAQLITQDQIFTFLHKTLADEYIRDIFMKKAECNSKSLNDSFELIKNRDFEAALKAVEKGEEPECLLFAARLHFYQGVIEKFEECMGRFEKWVSSDAAEQVHSSAHEKLQISYAILRIETADSLASLLALFEAAINEHGPRPDFFTTTAFRCTFFDSWQQALTILTDSRLEHSKPSQVLCFFVQINAIILTSENPMESFKIIAKFEEFVDGLSDDDEHKNWAAFALSKIYITFNNTNNAEVLLKELIRRDPSWAVYPIALAHVYTQKGEYKEATEFADKTLEMEKHNPEAHLLKQSLRLHSQGNKLDPAPYYVGLRAEAEPLLARCLSAAEFPFVNEVLRHIAFIEAKITAANSLRL